jgi:hypothetical protein
MKLSLGLIPPGSILLLAACSAAATPRMTSSVYRCQDGRSFSVDRNRNNALVRHSDERYNLSRKPSSLGVKYASTDATLIVDGQFAAFVTETTSDLNRCYEKR